ncbi:hypothetical protein EYF80_012521 [Liparis tanakae]|uniref:Uncharacterized protein n=1 Tax=Liparis tanakae TaxID=230148 RepID=A0A4Z2IIF2_9TELE|nr:hypothetical protein EYF80_012521 [Liparis tanakae]
MSFTTSCILKGRKARKRRSEMVRLRSRMSMGVGFCFTFLQKRGVRALVLDERAALRVFIGSLKLREEEKEEAGDDRGAEKADMNYCK